MASRLSALRQSAMDTGDQIGRRATRLAEQTQPGNLVLFALVAVSGFALGILTGLLVAPSSGFETRVRLGNRASEMLSNVRQMGRRGEKEVSEEVEKIA